MIYIEVIKARKMPQMRVGDKPGLHDYTTKMIFGHNYLRELSHGLTSSIIPWPNTSWLLLTRYELIKRSSVACVSLNYSISDSGKSNDLVPFECRAKIWTNRAFCFNWSHENYVLWYLSQTIYIYMYIYIQMNVTMLSATRRFLLRLHSFMRGGRACSEMIVASTI